MSDTRISLRASERLLLEQRLDEAMGLERRADELRAQAKRRIGEVVRAIVDDHGAAIAEAAGWKVEEDEDGRIAAIVLRGKDEKPAPSEETPTA